jgi:hypothetical protein
MRIMKSFTRAAILAVFSIADLLSSLASAQHPLAPPHPVAPTRVYAPPVYHAPAAPPATMRSPTIYAPNSTFLRGVALPSSSYHSTIVLPPVRPIRPVRRFPPLIIIYNSPFFYAEPFRANNFCWDASCNWFWPWTPDYASVSSPAQANYVLQAPETPNYTYGEDREDLPQLFLKDGTILNVTDYWVVDNQLHFKVIEQTGAGPVEQVIPIEELDLQTTVDANTKRGFRFLLRNEPFEQYVRDHPDGPPPVDAPAHP